MTRSPIARRAWLPLAGFGLIAALTGCARVQPSNEDLAGPYAPPDLRAGATPSGGISVSPTGVGAGGSAAGGYGFRRTGGIQTRSTQDLPPFDPNVSRMSPPNSDGSGDGDRGNPIPPDQSLEVKPAGQ